jgi:two-component sensor histidine kinase
LLEEIEAIKEKFRRSEERIASLLITQEALKSEISGHKKNFETVKNALKVGYQYSHQTHSHYSHRRPMET